jgi:transposase
MGNLTMSTKEREQLLVFGKLKNKGITQLEASKQLGITERWVRKKYKRYLKDDARGLVHKSRGRASPKRWSEEKKHELVHLLNNEWHDFGPTFTAEKLGELKGIKVSKETVRQAMIKEGLWQVKRKRQKHRKRRERRPMIGAMVQCDGSPHDWFEGRAPWCTLLVFIDDATSKILWLEFAKSESRLEVIQATKNYVSRYGRPHEAYVDFGSVFSVNLNNPDRDKKTQWERILADLSIKVTHAHSPQAKGRVERANKTFQDRLVKEMRLAKISSIEAANAFLHDSDFITKHNQRFAISPAQPGDAHRPTNTYDLDDIFCIKEERILANDYTIKYCRRVFQIERQQATIIRPKNTITVRTYLDGSIKLYVRKIMLEFNEIFERPAKLLPMEKTIKNTLYKPSVNSQRWVAGLLPLPTNSLANERVG